MILQCRFPEPPASIFRFAATPRGCRCSLFLRFALLLAVSFLTACSSTGAIPPEPAIETPEITSQDGSFHLTWDRSASAPSPQSYDYERYHDGELEFSTTLEGKAFFHDALRDGEYEFRVRGCGSDQSCSDWSSISLLCEDGRDGLFCWNQLRDGRGFKLPGRMELEGASVEVWDSILIISDSGCRIPIRAIRKAGDSSYKPLVYLHGGGWNSGLHRLSLNGGKMDIYRYKNLRGIAAKQLLKDDPHPVFSAEGEYDFNATFKASLSSRGLLVELLNEGYMVFDVEYLSMNTGVEGNEICETSSMGVLASAALVVEKLYDNTVQSAALPVHQLEGMLPVLLGESAGGHIAHYITTHQPEKVLRTVSLSGLVSWSQYRDWRRDGVVQFNYWYELFILGSVLDPVDRERLAPGGLANSMADIVSRQDFSIPQTVLANSPGMLYNEFEVKTPPVYYVNFEYDVALSDFFEDLIIPGAQAEYFCAYSGLYNDTTRLTLSDTSTGFNSRRLVDCGGGNYLDQYYDNPLETEDDKALVRGHAQLTEAQFRAVRDWLRYGEVTAAGYY